MRAFAYVDGYNLYYGLRKLCGDSREPWRWLDLARWIDSQSPLDFEVTQVRYFTAHVKPGGGSKANRQARYLRALKAHGVSIQTGKYKVQDSEWPLRDKPSHRVWVTQIEEKQSDVNLASRMLLDCLVEDDPPEAVILVSNDSDLVYPVRVLGKRGVPLGVLNPHPERPGGELKHYASWYRLAKASKVRGAQYPATLTDGDGSFSGPERWGLVPGSDGAHG